MPSRYEPTRELRELLIKRKFLGECAPNEGEENVLQYVIHCIYEDVHGAHEGVCAPRAWGSENGQTRCVGSETVTHP